MATSYENLPMEDDEFDESRVDFTDLEDQYQVRLDEGLDAFVVVDGLPVVPEDSKAKLVKFILRKLNSVGTVKEDGVHMPVGDNGKTEGYAFVEYNAPSEAVAAAKQLNLTALDKKHTMLVNKLTDIERYGGKGRVEEEYTPPTIPPFEQTEHLRSWLGDNDGRDQMVMFRGEKVGVFWNNKEDVPESVVDRDNWTESFVQWSPQGTFLTSIHAQGVQLWGGKQWTRQKRFAHPGVNLVDFSPSERYFTTWSHRPLQVDENTPVPTLGPEEDGKNYIIWDLATGKPLRSFATIDVPASIDAEGNPIKKKMQWPTFKWSSDDKYVARLTQGHSISIYELPSMKLMDKATVKIEGVMDFEWAPATPKRDGIKTYEQLFCYWTPELGGNPAKVGLMSVPSKEIVRTRNLFNVSDAKLHWQSEAAYVCVKVDRHSKSKKTLATNLEIFRVKEKGVPVEVVDSIKDTVINFAWEPKGNRFVLITTGEIPPAGAAVPPKTAVSFFAPEKLKGGAVGNFRHIRTADKKNSNAIYWSPKGRFVVIAALQSQQSFDLDFWDLSFEKPKDESEKGDKELNANLQHMATAEHYGVTDIEWDPSGRYVATVASNFRHQMENGYHIYDFKGTLLREEGIERFKQLIWRPRPNTLLNKEEQSEIRKNLRNYSKVFDEQDLAKKNTANKAVIEARQRMLAEWLEWRENMRMMLEDEGAEIELNGGKVQRDTDGEVEEVEEIVEEIVEESEEVIS